MLSILNEHNLPSILEHFGPTDERLRRSVYGVLVFYFSLAVCYHIFFSVAESACPAPTAKSVNSLAEKEINVLNEREDITVEVYWLQNNGVPKMYGTVKPLHATKLNTYQNHYWIVKDQASGEVLPVNDDAVCEYKVGADARQLIIVTNATVHRK